MPKYRKSKVGRKGDRELVAVMAAALAFAAGYLTAEASLQVVPHYVHWLVTFASSVVAYAIVLAWYWWRGRRSQGNGRGTRPAR